MQHGKPGKRTRNVVPDLKRLAVAPLRGQVEGCPSQAFCGIHLSTIVQQQFGRLHVVPQGRIVQGGHLLAVLDVEPRPAQDQQVHHGSRAGPRCQVQRCHEVHVSHAHLGPSCSTDVQGGSPILAPGVGVGATVQEEFNASLVPGQHGQLQGAHVSALIPVHGHPGPQQQLHHVAPPVEHSPVQRGPFVDVTGISLCFEPQQDLHRAQVPIGRGQVQRRLARARSHLMGGPQLQQVLGRLCMAVPAGSAARWSFRSSRGECCRLGGRRGQRRSCQRFSTAARRIFFSAAYSDTESCSSIQAHRTSGGTGISRGGHGGVYCRLTLSHRACSDTCAESADSITPRGRKVAPRQPRPH
ncbi:hypothetical protein JZ751_025399 [Albula glossodonta]|uniref:Uncharacterized protein n=1 Tax=Albula glossodonta TaxID=121402 RepID=A0A8T2NHG0_9TELE|nr:hypothetical protein JZ751_025399 [Albula glossodonta]